MSKIIIKLEFNGEIHKLPRFPQTYSDLVAAMEQSFKNKLPKFIILKYRDFDGDLISLSDDRDYQTAIKCLEEENQKSIKIIINQAQESELLGSKVEDNEEQPKVEEKPKENEEIVIKEIPVVQSEMVIVEEIREEVKEEVPQEKEEKPVKDPVRIQEHIVEVVPEFKEPEKELDKENQPNPVQIEELPVQQQEVLIVEKQQEVLIVDPEIIAAQEMPIQKPVEQEIPLILSEIPEVQPGLVILKPEEKKPIDPDDFSDLDNIVKALKYKMNAEKDVYNRKEEPHPIDSDIKTIAEDLQGKSEIKPEKKEEIQIIPFEKVNYPPILQELPKNLNEEEKHIEEVLPEDKKKKKEEKNEKIVEVKLETLKFMKEFFQKFSETQVAFDVPCYKCGKEKKIWNFSCKKCNDTGFIHVDTHKQKYSILSRIITEKVEKTAETCFKSLKSQLKKKASVEENLVFLPNPYFCVSCRTFPIKGENYICETCLNFAYCAQCHVNQYHPHPLKLAYYEEDPKKKQKIFSLHNLDDSKHSPKTEKMYKCSLINGPEALIESLPSKPIVTRMTIKNNGPKNWPEKMKLECVEGVYKGVFEDVKALKMGEIGGIEIVLQAMKDGGNYETKWKLAYDDENKLRKYFGPKVTFTVVVKNPEVKKDNVGIAWQDKGIFFKK